MTDISEEVREVGGPEKLSAALDHKFINFNGKPTSLREIYGDIQPTVGNFKPGVKLARAIVKNTEIIDYEPPKFPADSLHGDTYIEREILFHSTSTVSMSTLSPNIPDIPTAIATKLAEDTITHTPPVTLIMGEVNSGKSVTIQRIHRILRELMPTTLMIPVDLSIKVLFDEDMEYMTYGYLVQDAIAEDFRNLFDNLLQINPKRIVFLIDSADRMGGTRIPALVTLIKTLVEKSITVILTGRIYILESLEEEHIKTVAYEIPELNIIDAAKFFTNFWQARMITEMPDHVKSCALERLHNYVVMFTHALYKTPLPRIFAAFKCITEHFTNINQLDSVEKSLPIGCYNYVFNHVELTPLLLTTLESYIVTKYQLYINFTDKLNCSKQSIGDPVYTYGSTAIVQMIKAANADTTLIPPIMWKDFNDHTSVYRLYKYRAILTNYIDDTPQFINEEYQIFYAMQYLLKFFILESTENERQLLQMIFTNSHFVRLLEFLSPRMDVLSYDELENIAFFNGLSFDLLDNLIGNGLEAILLRILDDLKSADLLIQIQNYFAEVRRINFGPKRTFGMLQTKQSHPDYNCIETVRKSGTQLEALVENDMLAACGELHFNDITFGEFDSQEILRIALTKASPNFRFVKFLLTDIIADNRDQLNFNDLLYDLIDNVGDGCQCLANYLVECGANPKTTTRNGRTLLHIGVQWNNVTLLRYIIEELRVPTVDSVDSMGESIFSTALNSNPSPVRTMPDWWEMMCYLVESIDNLLLPNREIVNRSDDKFHIPKQDIDSPWFRFLISSSNDIQANTEDYDARTIVFHPIDVNDAVFERLSTLTRLIPPRYWRLSTKTLALRRNFVLAELYANSLQINVVEVLLRYRGAGPPLSQHERHYFENSIELLLERLEVDANASINARILQAFVDNVCITMDEVDIEWFTKQKIFKRLNENTRSKLMSVLEEHLNSIRGKICNEVNLSLAERMLCSDNEKLDISQILQIGSRVNG